MQDKIGGWLLPLTRVENGLVGVWEGRCKWGLATCNMSDLFSVGPM